MDGGALRNTGPSKPFDKAWDLGGAVTELGPGVDSQTFYPAGGGRGRRTTQRSQSTYCVDGIGSKGWVCAWVSLAATVVRAAPLSLTTLPIPTPPLLWGEENPHWMK